MWGRGSWGLDSLTNHDVVVVIKHFVVVFGMMETKTVFTIFV